MSTEPQKTAAPISSSALHRLLQDLQGLMQEIRRRVCADRKRYHATHNHQQIPNSNVGDIINRYVVACSRKQDASKATGQQPRTIEHEAPPSTSVDRTQHLIIDPSAATNRELSDHFHRNGHGSSLPSPLAERFKHSAWDHIHAAIRLAKSNDVGGARLHAQLADNSLKEAARYMDEQEYQRFIDEFEGTLERIADHPEAAD